jgi:signal peptidase II
LGRKVIIVITSILILDQIIKIWIKDTFAPYQTQSLIEGFIQLYYIENKGMAFGATLGEGYFAKYILSIFRLAAIIGIGFYIRKLIKEGNASNGLIMSVGLVFAGAAGNLIDSLCYDLIYGVDPIAWNFAKDAEGMYIIDEASGIPKLRPNGFLLGSVVDMFQFTTTWPTWMPEINLTLPSWLGGAELVDIRPKGQIFGAIWNLADFSISIGVGIIILKYRKFFGQKEEDKEVQPVASEAKATEE